MPDRSSKIPAFVVPAVTTTPTTGGSFGSHFAKAIVKSFTVIANPAVSTISGSTSRIANEFPIEECACLLNAIRTGARFFKPRFSRPVSRATVSAAKLAAEPPETNVPPALCGSPATSAIHRNT
ncbi:unannotated protein [freshwater metagenome]|uniref:Unannotated protein n=1 Tax=freshwater metagenome TaxID=449393 RepID=A0A6J6UEZ9_9ZZZZ